ncbi:MAG: hypothetical protein SGPRY_011202 [Prymnesium sp.]
MVLRCSPCSPTAGATESREHVVCFSDEVSLHQHFDGRRSHSRSTTAPPPWPKAMRGDVMPIHADDSPKARTHRARSRDSCSHMWKLALVTLLTYASLSAHLAARERTHRWTPSASGPEPGTAGGIPKIIHQMYRTDELPQEWADVPDMWATIHPDYTYMLWTDEMLRELIASNYSWLLSTYDAYPYDTQRWDASRYAILHKYGGLYADLDLKPKERVDAMLRGQTLLLPHTPNIGLTNAIMASIPAHPFMYQALSDLPDYAHAWYHLYVWAMFMRWSDQRYPVALLPAEDWGKCSVCRISCATHVRPGRDPPSLPQRVGSREEKAAEQLFEWRGSQPARQLARLQGDAIAGGSENLIHGGKENPDLPASEGALTTAPIVDVRGVDHVENRYHAQQLADDGSSVAGDPLRVMDPLASDNESPSRVGGAVVQGGLAIASDAAEPRQLIRDKSFAEVVGAGADIKVEQRESNRWISPFDHGRGSSWHSWDSAVVLFIFCQINYLTVLLGGLLAHMRTKSIGMAVLVAVTLILGVWLNYLLGLSVLEGYLGRPLIWLIMS